MTPKDAMQEVLSQVLQHTGYSVHVQADPGLNVLATVRTASSSMPFHLLRVRPDTSATREYLVCFQCGFLLRQSQLSANEQWDINASEKGRNDLESIVRKDVCRSGGTVGASAVELIAGNLLSGLIIQLRSAPLGLRIDHWIRNQYSCLDDQQRKSILRQLDDSAAVLQPKVKQMVPPVVYNASASINAAVAFFWSTAWNDKRLAVPYRASGFTDKATNLLKKFREIDKEPQNDRELIDAWATEVGIAKWYEYVAK